jgi:acetylornithine/succinyldiaminopimelate/putrescine aminotransferase
MRASARQRLIASESPPSLEIAKAQGSVVTDTSGRRYIDFFAGWCVGNFGWGYGEPQKALARFRGPDYVYPGYTYRPWGELAELLVAIAPGRLRKVFRATGGSEAVELALQAAMVHTGRRAFLSLEDSYHGNTIGALSIGASDNREHRPNLLSYCAKVKPPLDDSALARIELRLSKRDVAAFVMEPIPINLGVLIPSTEFMSGVQRACRRYGTLLVMDEVATGFGRTGTLFASEHYKLKPDALCVGKAITAGAAGMGALLTTAAVGKSMEDNGNFYSTYGWHPRSVAAAIATLRTLARTSQRLMRDVAATSEYFGERLAAMKFRQPVEIRRRGLAIGIEFEDEDYASKIEERCRRAGLLVNAEETTLLLLPALNIPRAVAARGLNILQRCV